MQTMRLPTSLTIGPFDILVNPRGHTIKDGFAGQYDANSQTILVDTELAPQEMVDTYLHEVFHALWRNAGLSNGDEDVEESTVSALATGFLGFMRDNVDALDCVWEAIAMGRRARLEHDLQTGGSFS